jgi:catechol 2,3-dioxygenase-like lactoylglutathione lyase family enzyme
VPVERINHIGVCVSDLERSLAFYRDGLGFAEVTRFDSSGEATDTLLGLADADLRVVFLQRDGVRIELLHYVSPGHRGTGEPRPMNALGLTHLSLRVSDLDATLAALERAGARVLHASRTPHAAFVTDPDGVRLELVAVSFPGGD